MSGHVSTTAIWNAKIGRLVLDDQKAFHAALKRMRLDDRELFEIEATRVSNRRTSAHNKAYWAFVVRPVALASDQSPEEVHRLFKAEFMPPERLVIADKRTGEVKFEREVEAGTTTRMSEDEFVRYMEKCRALGAQTLGIDFSPEGLFEQFGIGKGNTMGYTLSIQAQLKFVTEECYSCHVIFAMTEDHQRRLLENKSLMFFCPNGHSQHYIGKTEVEKLREQLEQQRQETERQRRLRVDAERRTVAQRGVVTKLKKRVNHGVCPHCERTVSQMARHIKTKHPEVLKVGIGEG